MGATAATGCVHAGSMWVGRAERETVSVGGFSDCVPEAQVANHHPNPDPDPDRDRDPNANANPNPNANPDPNLNPNPALTLTLSLALTLTPTLALTLTLLPYLGARGAVLRV